MLGVPEGERQQIRQWLDASLHREPGQLDAEPRERAGRRSKPGMYFHELTVEKRKNPGDDMLSRLTQVTVDRGDGEETGLDDVEIAGFATLLGGAGAETVTKLVGNAVVLFCAAPRPVAEDPRRPREDPARGRGDPALPAAVAVPGPLLRRRTASSRAARSPPASRCCSSPAPRRATRVRSSAPTSSTSNAQPGITHRVRPRRAQLPRRRARRAWRAASRSRSWRRAGAGSRSTKRVCAACTCRTSPATRTSRSARFASHRREAQRRGAVRSRGDAAGRGGRRRVRRDRRGREAEAGRHRHVHDLRVVARDRRHVVGQHLPGRRGRRRLAPLLLLVQAARLDAHPRPAARAAEVPRGDGRRVRAAAAPAARRHGGVGDVGRRPPRLDGPPRRRDRRRVPRARERRRLPQRAALSRLARARRLRRARSSTPRAGSTSTT